MSREQLHQLEQESFLEWRRQIAQIEESDHFILTPFERNLDMWRQLWRVVELSDVIVQIVDARNPELFYCADLAVYAKDVDSSKETILLLNKADLLTAKQRESWAESLNEKGITFAFFSAVAIEEENEEELELTSQLSPVQISTPDVLTRNQLISLLSSLWKGKT
jgi:large subunit GTPase 1